MRLIDADALLEALKGLSFPESLDNNVMTMFTHDVVDVVTNAPTVQREGWVSDDSKRLDYVADNFHVLGFTTYGGKFHPLNVNDKRVFNTIREVIDAFTSSTR